MRRKWVGACESRPTSQKDFFKTADNCEQAEGLLHRRRLNDFTKGAPNSQGAQKKPFWPGNEKAWEVTPKEWHNEPFGAHPADW